MTKRFFVALVTAFILLQILGFQRAQGQSNPDPKLVEGAKKEGQMIFYTTMTLDQSKEVVDRFQKKYPFIKPTLFRTGGGPFLNKIFTEARGGRHAWDVVVGRAEMVVPLMQRKVITSYRSPETKMIDEDLVDREGYWSAYYVISMYWDGIPNWSKEKRSQKLTKLLVDPKWKGGQLSFDNEAYGMLQGLMRAWGREKALAYFKRIAAIEPSMKRGNTERVALAAAGETR